MLRYRTVRTRQGREIAVATLGPDSGRSAPVLLVHPINLRKECWLDITRVLAAERTCVVLDLAGHGESSDAAEYTLAGWVADCRDVMAALGLDRVHLVGGSLGGTIALCLAGELPAALSVTALGSAVDSASDNAVDSTQSRADPTVVLTLDPDNPAAVAGMFAVLAAAAVAPGSADAVVSTVRHLTNSHGGRVVREVLDAALAADATAWLAGVRCPVLVLTGEFDTTAPPAAGARMAAGVGGHHEVLPGTGHLPMLEDAATVLDLLVPHLRAAESKAGAL